MDGHNITQVSTEEVVTATTILNNQVLMGTSQAQQTRVIVTLVTSMISATLSIVLNALNIMVATNSQFEFPISNCVAIVSMSFADMIIGLSTILRVLLNSWERYICRLHLIVSVTGVRVSVVSLILIILDRYVAIVYPFIHNRYAKKGFCIILVTVTWVFTAIANIIENATGTYFYDPNRRLCDVKLSINRVLISTMFVYFIPLTTMLAVYTHLLVIVRRKLREIARIHPLQDLATSSHDLQGREEPNIPPESDNVGQYKVIGTFFAVTAAFTVTTIPNRIIRLISIFRGAQTVSPGVTQFCRILVISGSWMNFVIFSVMNHTFRRVLKHMLKRRFIAVNCHHGIV